MRPPGCFLPLAFEGDAAQLRHVVWEQGCARRQAELETGPAIGIVRGGDHGDGANRAVDTGKIGHRREGESNVGDMTARRHEAFDHGILDGLRIAAEVVTDDDRRGHAAAAHQGAHGAADDGKAG